MRKNCCLKIFLFALVTALLAVALVACNPDNAGGTDEDGGKTPTPTTYSVTFDSNGAATDFSEYNQTGLAYGSLVKEPPTTPFKTGYEFNYWETSDGEQFYFATDTVKADLVLKAHYTAKTYKHDVTSFLTDGKWTYEGGTVTAPAEGSFVTTYNSSDATIPVPATDNADDWFVYWYYYDGDTQVRLTEWAQKGATSVKLVAKYTVDRVLTVYPMFHSQLPDVDVDFIAKEGEMTGDVVSVKLNDTFALSQVPTVTRDGYDFVEWYYIVTSKDDDGNEKRTEVRFVMFDDVTEDADNGNATKVSETVASKTEDGKYYLNLYAKWIKHIEISSTTDITALRNDIAAAVNGEDELEKYAYLNANIYVTGDVTLDAYAPLYDEENPFNGVVDGLNSSVKSTVTINPAAGADIGFIGANTGIVKNLRIVIAIDAADVAAINDAEGDSVRVGGVAVVNMGTIDACETDLVVNLAGVVKKVYIGGIAAVTGLGSSVNNCTVNLAVDLSVTDASVRVGGIVGSAETDRRVATAINACRVTVADGTHVVATGGGSVYFGGIAGYADDVNVTKNGVALANVTVNAGKQAYVGALAGKAVWGTMSECFADGAALGITAATVNAGGAIGYSETVLTNARVSLVSLDVVLTDGQTSFVGGITGTTTGTGGTRGNVSFVYAVVGNVNVSAPAGATAYVGAMSGRADTVTVNTAFVNVNVTVNGDGSDGVTTSFSVARTVTGTTLKNSYYASENTVKVGESAITGASEEEPAFKFTKVEGATNTDVANYSDSEFTLGDKVLDLDRNVWEMVTVGGKAELHLATERVQGDPEEGDASQE